jgi:hypothetical protein
MVVIPEGTSISALGNLVTGGNSSQRLACVHFCTDPPQGPLNAAPVHFGRDGTTTFTDPAAGNVGELIQRAHQHAAHLRPPTGDITR